MKPAHALTVLVATAAGGIAVVAALDRHRAAVPPRCQGERFDLLTAPGGRSPYIRLAADGRTGAFLLDYGTTASSLSQDVFQPEMTGGGKIVIDQFSLPSFPSGRFNRAKYDIAPAPPGGQLGVIGTDFLSLLTADFRFRDGGGDVVLGTKPCNGDLLRARGMIAVRETGFFSSDPRRVQMGRGNVPVLFLRIGMVSAWAQIDTGYDDREYPPSIDINEALYRLLSAGGIGLQRVGDSRVITCEGGETREAYRAAAGNVTLTTDSGHEISALADVALIRKAANACGGIADLSEPAAQLGVSILARLGAVVFDPMSETVWVAPTGTPNQLQYEYYN
jgi:hypothetical protein